MAENLFTTNTLGSSHSDTKPLFEGNDIYTVRFDGCQIRDIQGKKEENKDKIYKTLVMSFSNEDGYFTHTVFEPDKPDFARPENDIMGNPLKFPRPSNVENLLLLFKHLIDAVSPEISKKIAEGTETLNSPDWDALRQKVVDFTEPAKGKVITQIKLMKSGSKVDFPFFTGLNRAGEPYVNNNIIGKKLFFTNYEKNRISAGSPAAQAPSLDLNISGALDNSAQAENLDFTVLGNLS